MIQLPPDQFRVAPPPGVAAVAAVVMMMMSMMIIMITTILICVVTWMLAGAYGQMLPPRRGFLMTMRPAL